MSSASLPSDEDPIYEEPDVVLSSIASLGGLPVDPSSDRGGSVEQAGHGVVAAVGQRLEPDALTLYDEVIDDTAGMDSNDGSDRDYASDTADTVDAGDTVDASVGNGMALGDIDAGMDDELTVTSQVIDAVSLQSQPTTPTTATRTLLPAAHASHQEELAILDDLDSSMEAVYAKPTAPAATTTTALGTAALRIQQDTRDTVSNSYENFDDDDDDDDDFDAEHVVLNGTGSADTQQEQIYSAVQDEPIYDTPYLSEFSVDGWHSVAQLKSVPWWYELRLTNLDARPLTFAIAEFNFASADAGIGGDFDHLNPLIDLFNSYNELKEYYSGTTTYSSTYKSFWGALKASRVVIVASVGRLIEQEQLITAICTKKPPPAHTLADCVIFLTPIPSKLAQTLVGAGIKCVAALNAPSFAIRVGTPIVPQLDVVAFCKTFLLNVISFVTNGTYVSFAVAYTSAIASVSEQRKKYFQVLLCDPMPLYYNDWLKYTSSANPTLRQNRDLRFLQLRLLSPNDTHVSPAGARDKLGVPILEPHNFLNQLPPSASSSSLSSPATKNPLARLASTAGLFASSSGGSASDAADSSRPDYSNNIIALQAALQHVRQAEDLVCTFRPQILCVYFDSASVDITTGWAETLGDIVRDYNKTCLDSAVQCVLFPFSWSADSAWLFFNRSKATTSDAVSVDMVVGFKAHSDPDASTFLLQEFCHNVVHRSPNLRTCIDWATSALHESTWMFERGNDLSDFTLHDLKQHYAGLTTVLLRDSHDPLLRVQKSICLEAEQFFRELSKRPSAALKLGSAPHHYAHMSLKNLELEDALKLVQDTATDMTLSRLKPALPSAQCTPLALTVIGEVGSGKTRLLQSSELLLWQAWDPSKPIPLLVSLSSKDVSSAGNERNPLDVAVQKRLSVRAIAELEYMKQNRAFVFLIDGCLDAEALRFLNLSSWCCHIVAAVRPEHAHGLWKHRGAVFGDSAKTASFTERFIQPLSVDDQQQFFSAWLDGLPGKDAYFASVEAELANLRKSAQHSPSAPLLPSSPAPTPLFRRSSSAASSPSPSAFSFSALSLVRKQSTLSSTAEPEAVPQPPGTPLSSASSHPQQHVGLSRFLSESGFSKPVSAWTVDNFWRLFVSFKGFRDITSRVNDWILWLNAFPTILARWRDHTQLLVASSKLTRLDLLDAVALHIISGRVGKAQGVVELPRGITDAVQDALALCCNIAGEMFKRELTEVEFDAACPDAYDKDWRLLLDVENRRIDFLLPRCPIAVSDAPTGHGGESQSSGLVYRFEPACLREYFAVRHVLSVEGQIAARLKSYPLLSKDSSLLDLFSSIVNGNFVVQRILASLMAPEAGRGAAALEEESTAPASNAASILNMSGYSFHSLCLRNARIPHAELRNAYLNAVDFTSADLADADLQGSSRAGWIVKDATLPDIASNDANYLLCQLKHFPQSACLSSDGLQITVVDTALQVTRWRSLAGDRAHANSASAQPLKSWSFADESSRWKELFAGLFNSEGGVGSRELAPSDSPLYCAPSPVLSPSGLKVALLDTGSAALEPGRPFSSVLVCDTSGKNVFNQFLSGHESRVTSISFASETKVVTGDEYGVVRLWDITTAVGDVETTIETKFKLFPHAEILYAYNAVLSHELSVKKGDVVYVLDTSNEHWCWVSLRGAPGCIPSYCVSPNPGTAAANIADVVIVPNPQSFPSSEAYYRSILPSLPSLMNSGVRPVFFAALVGDEQQHLLSMDRNTLALWNLRTHVVVCDKKIPSASIVSVARVGYWVACLTSQGIVLLFAISASTKPSFTLVLTQSIDFSRRTVCDPPVSLDSASVSMAFSRDECYFACCAWNRCLIFDLKLFKLIANQPFAGTVKLLGFTNDSSALVLGVDKSVRVWGFLEHRAGANHVTKCAPFTSLSLCESLNMVVSSEIDGSVRAWTASGLKYLHKFPKPIVSVQTVAVSPAGNFIAVSCPVLHANSPGSAPSPSVPSGLSLKIWRASDGAELRLAQGPSDRLIRAVGFSSDGSLLACGEQDGHVTVWTTVDGRIFLDLGKERDASQPLIPGNARPASDAYGHPGPVSAVAFATVDSLASLPNGERQILVSASTFPEESVVFWSLQSGMALRMIHGVGRLAALSHCGTLLGTLYCGVDAAPSLLASLTSSSSSSSSALGSGSLSSNGLQSAASSPGASSAPIGAGTAAASTFGSVALLPLASCLSFTGGTLRRHSSFAHYSLSGHKGDVHSIAFAHSRTLVATGGTDRAVRIWAVPENSSVVLFSPKREDIALRCLHVLEVHNDAVTSLLFHSDGRLFSASLDGTIKISGPCLGAAQSVGGAAGGSGHHAAPSSAVLATASKSAHQSAHPSGANGATGLVWRALNIGPRDAEVLDLTSATAPSSCAIS